MLFNKLTLISIAAIIAIASILVFIIPTDSIETQSVINSEKPPINHTLSLDQSISVSEANNRVAINLFKLLENDTQKNIFFSPFSILYYHALNSCTQEALKYTALVMITDKDGSDNIASLTILDIFPLVESFAHLLILSELLELNESIILS